MENTIYGLFQETVNKYRNNCMRIVLPVQGRSDPGGRNVSHRASGTGGRDQDPGCRRK